MWEKLLGFVKSPLQTIGKRLAIKIIQSQGDHLQELTLNMFRKDGPRAIDRNFDVIQGKTKALILRLRFIPGVFKDKLLEIVQDEGDRLQSAVKTAASSGGELAINKAFDMAQEKTIERIQAL